jgi:hypothetical protein
MYTSSPGRWVKLLKGGNMDITNQPRSATAECNKQKVDVLISENQRIMVRKIAVQLGLGHCAV